MAIYHLNAQVISRGKGRSVIAAAAYRAGTRLKDELQGLIYDYKQKGGVVYTEIFLPAHAPARLRVRETLWNEVDREEKRKDAQTAREMNVALPVELDREEQEELVRNFARSMTDEGMIADVAIHDKEDGNPHAHIMLTTREIGSDGTWGKKNRDWNKKEVLEGWRVRWEEMANDALQKAGSEERIDHRSNEARGIEKLPTIHEGFAAREMEKRGEVSDRCEINREIKAVNQKWDAVNKEERMIRDNDLKDMEAREVQVMNQAAALTRKVSLEEKEVIEAWKKFERQKAFEAWKKKRTEAVAVDRQPMASSGEVDELEKRRRERQKKADAERRKEEQRKPDENKESSPTKTEAEKHAEEIERDFMDQYKDILGSNKSSLEKRLELHALEQKAKRILEEEKTRQEKELRRRAEEQVRTTPEGSRLAREIEEADRRIRESYDKVQRLQKERDGAYREYERLRKEKPKDGFFDFLFGNKEKDQWKERVRSSKKNCSALDMLVNAAVSDWNDEKDKKKEKQSEFEKLCKKAYGKLQDSISNPVAKILLHVVKVIATMIFEMLKEDERNPMPQLVATSDHSPTPGENDSRFMGELQKDELLEEQAERQREFSR